MSGLKKLLIVEPFFGGSHKQWSVELAEEISMECRLLTLPERFWKWRMYGAGVTLGRRAARLEFKPDLVLAGSMIDLTTFRSLARIEAPHALYFHENQFAYPERSDYEERRDLHYRWINYTSALAADHVLFNSRYNRDTFFGGLSEMLATFPEYRNLDTVDEIKRKSRVLPIGMKLSEVAAADEEEAGSPPLLLWNHRWEHDKNPEQFFEALEGLKKRGVDFRLAVCGRSYQKSPPVFERAREVFKDELVHFGYCERPTYLDILRRADFLPVTSRQDFFGISVVEAACAGVLPLLPQRLAYPEIIPPSVFGECYYEGRLCDSLEALFLMSAARRGEISRRLKKRLLRYDWAGMRRRYEELFMRFIRAE